MGFVYLFVRQSLTQGHKIIEDASVDYCIIAEQCRFVCITLKAMLVLIEKQQFVLHGESGEESSTFVLYFEK